LAAEGGADAPEAGAGLAGGAAAVAATSGGGLAVGTMAGGEGVRDAAVFAGSGAAVACSGAAFAGSDGGFAGSGSASRGLSAGRASVAALSASISTGLGSGFAAEVLADGRFVAFFDTGFGGAGAGVAPPGACGGAFTQSSGASTRRTRRARGVAAGLVSAFIHFGFAADLPDDDPAELFAGSAAALDPALFLVAGAFPDVTGASFDPLSGTPLALASPATVPAGIFEEFARSVAMTVPCGRRGKPAVPFSSY